MLAYLIVLSVLLFLVSLFCLYLLLNNNYNNPKSGSKKQTGFIASDDLLDAFFEIQLMDEDEQEALLAHWKKEVEQNVSQRKKQATDANLYPAVNTILSKYRT